MRRTFIVLVCFFGLLLLFALVLVPDTAVANKYKRSADKSASTNSNIPRQKAVKEGAIYSVTFYSQPGGALLSKIDGSGQIGLSPSTLNYSADSRYFQDGCLMVMGVIAQWVSGATQASASPIALCAGPQSYTVNIVRPEKAAGSKKDIEFAIEYEKQRSLQEQQAKQQIINGLVTGLFLQTVQNNNQQTEQYYQNMFNQFSKPQSQQNKNIKCESRLNAMGNRIMTNCH